jgi:dTDP-4-amino-4,6-dideoxygalactose transaminase
MRINVTKTFLPPINEYEEYLQRVWSSGQLTNQGPLLKEFEKKTKEYLNVNNFHLVTNGTLALQLALRALNITEGEVITTPFSYVATTSAILWERCKPVYVDIKPDTLNIDADKIESAITSNTKAILAVHVFGNPCEIEKIEKIARKNKLKVIYDGAHSFGAKYKGRSLLDYGDISICSFHATKLFHTIEGGGVFTNDKTLSERIDLLKRFGHHGDKHTRPGINAKASEFQAAMGLANLRYVNENIKSRRFIYDLYKTLLSERLTYQAMSNDTDYNYSYFPVIFKSEEETLDIVKKLNSNNIYPRRYFFPSLNTLEYLDVRTECPVSEDVSKKILCLPIYHDLDQDSINKICEVINV